MKTFVRLLSLTLASIIAMLPVANFASAQYCTPQSVSGCSDGHYINGFTFAGISNDNSGCGANLPPGYTYYNDMTATVIQGFQYQLFLRNGPNYPAGFSVWIDYDKNGTFSLGERIYSVDISTSTTITTTITIPSSPNILPGATRLRVRSQHPNGGGPRGNNIDPCGAITFSETEDYNIMILGSVQQFSPGQNTLLKFNHVYDPSVILNILPPQTALTQRFSYKIKVVDAGNALPGTIVYEMLDPVSNSTSITNFTTTSSTNPPQYYINYRSTKSQGPWAKSDGTLYTDSAQFFASGIYRAEVVYEVVDSLAQIISSQTVSQDFFVAIDYGNTSLTTPSSLAWVTYYGGSSQDIGSDVAVDKSGNVFITGYTHSTSGIATDDAYQTTIGGSSDGFIAKFDSSGALQWATYGSGGAGIATDGNGNVYALGYGRIAKFNSVGTHQWAVDYDGNSIVADEKGNVYITGATNSDSDIATEGAHQSILSGDYDAFIAKFDSSGVLQWGTYYGGSDRDEGACISVDPNGNVYITGETQSTSGIATTGAHQSTLSGSTDVFVAKFDSSGVLQWGTYYGGADTDWSFGVAVDRSGNVCITGLTWSYSGIATGDAYQPYNSFSVDGYKNPNGQNSFIVKFNTDGQRLWGTYYIPVGANIYKSVREDLVAIDGSGNIYIAGIVNGGNIATTGAQQTNYGGGDLDAFISKFNSHGIREWATYYGGSNTETCFSIAADDSANVYITGYTTNRLTRGIDSTSNVFLVKFSEIDVTTGSDIVPTPGFVYTQNIRYVNFQAADITVTNSVAVMGFKVRDGGTASPDADNVPTTLTALTIQAEHPGMVRSLALYLGSTELGEATVPADGTIQFTGLNVMVADNASVFLTLRATFTTSVTDNTQLTFTVTGATAAPGGTGFLAPDAGGAVSSTAGDDNRIEVIADRLLFTNQPSDVNVGEQMQPDVTVSAEDIFGNEDSERENMPVTVSNANLSGSPVSALLNTIGIATYGALTFNAPANNQTLLAQSTGLTSAISSVFKIMGSKVSDIIATPGFAYTQNIPYANFQAADITATNSVAVMGLKVRDGGATAPDADNAATTLTALTIQAEQPGMVRRLALYLGTTKLTEVTVPVNGNVQFTGLNIMVADNASVLLTLRATFTTNVTDNMQLTFIVTGATSASGGTQFLDADAGGAVSSTTGDDNRIEVIADRLRFTNQPSDVDVGAQMQPAVIVRAEDVNQNTDADLGNKQVTVSNAFLSGSPVSAQLSATGIYTYSTLTFNAAAAAQTLLAQSTGLTSATSNTFNILPVKVVWLQGTSIGSTDGQTLLVWIDDAGGDDNAVPAGALLPTYRSTGAWTINGKPTVQFGAGMGLGIAARNLLNGGGEKVMFVVFKTGANVLTRQVLVDIGGLSNGFNMYLANNNIYAGAWDNQNAWLSRSVTTNTVYLAQFVYNGSMLQLSANAAPNGTGSATYTNFNDSYITSSAMGNGIGAAIQQTRYHNATNIAAGVSDPFQGTIAEVVIMNEADVNGRTQILDYLNQKYAIGMTGQPIAKYAAAEESVIEPTTGGELTVYPNPLNDEAVISYFIPAEYPVRLLIQNALGKTVAVLAEGLKTKGVHQVVYYPGRTPAGVYRLVLQTPFGSTNTPLIIQR